MTVKCFVFDRSNVFYVIKEILNVFLFVLKPKSGKRAGREGKAHECVLPA